MTDVPIAPAVAKTPRPVGTAVGLAGPLLLLGLYLSLVTPQGTRAFDGFAGRNVGTGIVALAALYLTIAATLLIGLLATLWAVWRRERPVWLSRSLLVVHVVLVLLALNAVG